MPMSRARYKYLNAAEGFGFHNLHIFNIIMPYK